MKTFFIGHGSPLNAISDNGYTAYLSNIRNGIQVPECVIVFSAHWLTRGTFITGAQNPKQIYDFYGFPDELYQVKYAPPGSPDTAEAINAKLPEIQIDYDRGIDHAAWAVIKHIFPLQNIPVLEMSMNVDLSESGHFQLGKKLSELRLHDVLFIGSGNAVHNLNEIDFSENAKTFPWATECNEWLKARINEGSVSALIDAKKRMPHYKRASPTDDHYMPLLYVLGFAQGKITIEYDEIQNGSISMLSISV